MAWWRLVALLLCIAACQRIDPPTAAFPQDAYIWQHRWSQRLRNALGDSAAHVNQWRVLVANVDARGRWQSIAINNEWIADSGVIASPVVRIEAPALVLQSGAERERLIAQIRRLAAEWPNNRIEIDYDCPTRQLASYAVFLDALKRALPSTYRVAVTVLPDWMDNAELTTVLAHVDEAVLQTHSILNTEGVLFSAQRAIGWTAKLARLTSKPFWVALPTYGSRLTKDDDGRIVRIESETEPGNETGQELFAAPREVAKLIKWVAEQRPRHLKGAVWFRLPLSGDRRAWSPNTWHAIMAGHEATAQLSVALEGRPGNGDNRVVVHNRSGIDGELPSAVVVGPDCSGGVASREFLFEQQGTEAVFLRRSNRLFRAEEAIDVGYTACRQSARAKIDDWR